MAWPKGMKRTAESITKERTTKIRNILAGKPDHEAFRGGLVIWKTLCYRTLYGRERMAVQVTCYSCKKTRWHIWENLAKRVRDGFTGRCGPCETQSHFGTKHPNWQGGRRTRSDGKYILRVVGPDHPFACMRNVRNEIYEHRLVMAGYLGRPLQPWEHVHHKNGDTHDNCPENLELLTNSTHQQVEALLKRIASLEALLRQHRIPIPQ